MFATLKTMNRRNKILTYTGGYIFLFITSKVVSLKVITWYYTRQWRHRMCGNPRKPYKITYNPVTIDAQTVQ